MIRTKGGGFHFVDLRVGKQLRRRREELRITRKRLAEIGGVSHQQIHKYECAVNRVPPEILFRFARFFSVPVAYFFDGLPPTTTGNPSVALAEIELRRKHVEAALADSRIEGYPPPSPAEKAIHDAYIRGEIEACDLVEVLKKRLRIG